MVLEAGREVMGIHLNHIIVFTQVANLALSLLTNIFATSIIAVKAWYVPFRVDDLSFHHFFDGTLMDDTHGPKGNTARP